VKQTKNKVSRHKDIERIFAEGTLIDDALARGVREALRRHKQAGLPIAVWEKGQTVWVPPDAIELRDNAGNRRTKAG